MCKRSIGVGNIVNFSAAQSDSSSYFNVILFFYLHSFNVIICDPFLSIMHILIPLVFIFQVKSFLLQRMQAPG